MPIHCEFGMLQVQVHVPLTLGNIISHPSNFKSLNNAICWFYPQNLYYKNSPLFLKSITDLKTTTQPFCLWLQTEHIAFIVIHMKLTVFEAPFLIISSSPVTRRDYCILALGMVVVAQTGPSYSQTLLPPHSTRQT